MNLNNNPIIIGIDHGYGNIKTAHTCFRTGVTVHDREPTFKNDLLIFNGKYYTIGEGHKEFAADKMTDGDYYILTLAAIGRELNIRKITSARIHLAAGLPLTWVSEQKDAFRAYLLQKEIADFTFRDVDYHVEFAGADIFPQGFAAVAANLRDFTGTNMLCDIGNGTMNVMYINERRPVPDKCYTEKFGTHQCMLAVRESVLRQFGKVLDDATIERVLRHGKADIADRYLTAIRETAAEYVSGIFRRLREHEYDPELMKLHVVGGGSCLVKNFGDYEKSRVIFNDDICATAKGYPFLSENQKDLFKEEKAVIGKCPRCGGKVCEGRKNYYCEKKDCAFVMWKNDRFFEERKTAFTPKIAAALLAGGRAKVKKLYSPKTGKTYDGSIVLADTGRKYVNYRIELARDKELTQQA